MEGERILRLIWYGGTHATLRMLNLDNIRTVVGKNLSAERSLRQVRDGFLDLNWGLTARTLDKSRILTPAKGTVWL